MTLVEFLDYEQGENLYYLDDDYELVLVGNFNHRTLSETGKVMWRCDRSYDAQELGPQVTFFSELMRNRDDDGYDLKCNCKYGSADYCSTIDDCFLSPELIDAIEAAIESANYRDDY
jgi:hypothetical protein